MSFDNENESKLSPVEEHRKKCFLRGMAEEFADPAIDHLSEESKVSSSSMAAISRKIATRKNRSKAGAYMFMIGKMPGEATADPEYLALDDIAGEYANTLRLTTRPKHPVPRRPQAEHSTMAAINDSLVTTLGACGDINRNVLSCPALPDPIRRQMMELCVR